MAAIFEAKWANHKCPKCGESWEIGELLTYEDDIVVHATCTPLVTHTGKKEVVCPRCFLTSCDCE